MVVDEQQIGAVKVIRPMGPLSGKESVDAFRARSQGVVQRAKGRLVLDSSELSYVDSSGLEGLLELAEDMESMGQTLRVGAAGDTLKQTIVLTELSEHFELHEEVQNAVRSFR